MDKREAWPEGAVLRLGSVSYTIEKLMGKGANALVYQAFYEDALQVGRRHTVLIKELFPLLPGEGAYRAEGGVIAVRPEAAVLYDAHKESFLTGNTVHLNLQDARMNRANTNLNSHEAYQTLYTVLDLKPGVTLHERINAGPPMTLPEAAALTRAVLRALLPFHRLGILHLDISPDNILFPEGTWELEGKDAEAFLIDYNSAWPMERLTRQQGLYFSLKEPYSAPEVRLRESERIGAPADLFSVAVLFAELLKQGPLTFEEISSSVSGCLFAVERSLLAGSPATVAYQVIGILKKGMRLSPPRRYQNIAEMLEDFNELIRRIDGVGVTHGALWEASARAFQKQLCANPILCEPNAPLTQTARIKGYAPDTLPRLLKALSKASVRHMLLYSEGGAGKTTQLLSLLAEGLLGYSPRKAVPVYIPLGLYAGEPDYIRRSILAGLRLDETTPSLADAYLRLQEILTQPLCERGVAVPAVVLLLDGWNEVLIDTARLKREIRQLCGLGGVTIVLASRSPDASLPLTEAALQPLDEDRLALFLARAKAPLPEEAAQRALLRNPMLLTLYAKAFENQPFARPFADEQAILSLYLAGLVKARAHAALLERDYQAEYLMEVLLPYIARRMRRRKRYFIDAAALFALLRRHYRFLGSPVFCRRYPQFIGKGGAIRGGAQNAEAWFESMVTALAQKQFRLLVREAENRFRFTHQLYVDHFEATGARLSRQICKRRVRKGLACLSAAVLLSAAIAFTVLASKAEEAARVEDGARAAAYALDLMGVCLGEQAACLDLRKTALKAATEFVGGQSDYGDWQAQSAAFTKTLGKMDSAYLKSADAVLNNAAQQSPSFPVEQLRALLSLAPAARESAAATLEGLQACLNPDAAWTAAKKAGAIDAYERLVEGEADVLYAECLRILSFAGEEEKEAFLQSALVYLPLIGERYAALGAELSSQSLQNAGEQRILFAQANLLELGLNGGEGELY